MKIERKQTTEAFLNEKLTQITLFLRSKGVQFLIWDDKRASDLKELSFWSEFTEPCGARFLKNFSNKNVRDTKIGQ